MWIVALALRRPYTFVVAALLLLAVGWQVIRKAPTDILPNVDIPVISVVWSYEGLPAEQIERQITQYSEYSLTNNVEDVARVESQSFDGASVIRVYLQPGANLPSVMALVTAVSQSITRRMPPGIAPPVIVRYTASSVPILQLSFSSDRMPEEQIFDHVNQRVRAMLGTVQGTRMPLPAGGKFRQIVVDLDPEALKAQGLSPHEVATAISSQNLVLPTGIGQGGRARVPGQPEQQPRGDRRPERHPHPRARGCPRPTCATWRTCTTASRCRPTWPGRTAAARWCCR